MALTIKPKKLCGKVNIQISKSEAHRSLIAAALSDKESILKPWVDNVGIDIEVTKEALKDLCKIKSENGYIKATPKKLSKNKIIINAKESGTSLRLLIPIMSSLGINAIFKCSNILLKRPLNVYEDIWKKQNISFEYGEDYIEIDGKLKSGDFKVRGDISSQFISGLLFSLPLLEGDSKIIIEGNIESKPYIFMTLKTLKLSGIKTIWKDDTIYVAGKQKYKSRIFDIESDWSHAAFFIAAGALGEKVILSGLNEYSLQGDREIINIVKTMGAKVNWEKDGSLTVSHNGRLKALDIDISNIPDLAPILAVLASYAKGKTTLYNAKRLKYKESDRIYDLKDSITKIGAKINAKDDMIEIEGVEYLKGGYATSHNDHRIAMAISIASIISKNDIILDGENAVKKSSSIFFKQFEELGAVIESD